MTTCSGGAARWTRGSARRSEGDRRPGGKPEDSAARCIGAFEKGLRRNINIELSERINTSNEINYRGNIHGILCSLMECYMKKL